MFRGPDHIAIRRGVAASTGQVPQDERVETAWQASQRFYEITREAPKGSRPVYRLRDPLSRPSDAEHLFGARCHIIPTTNASSFENMDDNTYEP
jgi:hypothetical protein